MNERGATSEATEGRRDGLGAHTPTRGSQVERSLATADARESSLVRRGGGAFTFYCICKLRTRNGTVFDFVLGGDKNNDKFNVMSHVNPGEAPYAPNPDRCFVGPPPSWPSP